MDAVSDTVEDTAPPRRKLPRAARRVQLIEATIETIGARGIARTTMGDVAKQAGLSHGLVNFHFQTKDNLLHETLLYLADEFRDNWMEAVAVADPYPAAQLEALLRADFRPEVCTPARLSAWCAFWGEAGSRPLYQQMCGEHDVAYDQQIESLCQSLITAGAYPHISARAARVLRTCSEGVWLDLMMPEPPYDLTEGLTTLMACAQALFPLHFTVLGRIDPAG